MCQHDECTQGRDAEAALFDRFAASIFGYARLFAPSWEDAEDVTLEVFTAALEQGNLSSLSEQQQLAWLRLGEGLRFAEIAVLLDKREEAVRKLWSRTLALLRRIYERE